MSPELDAKAAGALAHLAAAVLAEPRNGDAWVRYLAALTEAGAGEAAKHVLRQGRSLGLAGETVDEVERAIAGRWGDAEPADINTLFDRQRFGEVEFIVRALLVQHAHRGDVWGMLGAAVQKQGRASEAADLLRKSVELSPGDARLQYNLAACLISLGRHADAQAHLRACLALDPAFKPALAALGRSLNQTGQALEARGLLRDAIGAGLIDSDLYAILGTSLGELGDGEGAVLSYAEAIRLDPNNAAAYCNLANIQTNREQFAAAEANYKAAIALDPRLMDAYANWAETVRSQGRLVEAQAICDRAMALQPDFARIHQVNGVLSSYLSDHSLVVSESDRALALGDPDGLAWGSRLYTFSYHPDLSAEAIYREFVRWGDGFPDPVTDVSGHDRAPARRLKIGYVSPDFRRHTSRFYFMPLMANHDHRAFEIFAYSNVLLADAHTDEFKAVFDQWRDIRGLSAEAAARLVREDQIDILVDCCNHMRDHRLDIFALKPAPIQVTWLGAAWTTGLKTVDYVLFDNYLAPEGTLAREAIVRLPDCFIAYRPPATAAGVGPLPASISGQVTFGYSGRTERLNRHTFRVWGEILRRIPNARLILDYMAFGDPLTQAHYRRLMGEHGLDPARVVMRRSPDIFAGLNEIDILLDSFPHSGGTMLFDALWMGVPALTLKGRPPLGRIGTSLMMNLGMPDWVAETEADYIGKAVAFAADLDALTRLRAGLRDRMRASPLMDEAGFTRGVEAAFRKMWTDWASAPNP